MNRATPKWRPSLGTVAAAVLGTVVCLPLVSLIFLRLYENQLIGQTEGALIAQSAALGAAFAQKAAEVPDLPRGAPRALRDNDRASQQMHDMGYTPLTPQLDLAQRDIATPRPAPRPVEAPLTAAQETLGAAMAPLLWDTQRITLAGFRLLDANGVVIAGAEEVGQSLAHVEEVAAALEGQFQSQLRTRIWDEPPPPLYSLSRGTKVRVFTAMPVYVEGRVVGVVYASRTPENILKHLYRERDKVAMMIVVTIIVVVTLWLVLVRTVTSPLRQLISKTEAIAGGDRSAIAPLHRHGTKEVAALSDSFLSMAEQLSVRSDYVATFAAHVSHELKAPLTSILGAVEILSSGSEVTEETRHKFLKNMEGDAHRMTALLDALREMARAEHAAIDGTTSLEQVLEDIAVPEGLELVTMTAEDAGEDIPLSISAESLAIALGHLIDNAHQHGAQMVAINLAVGERTATLDVTNDGEPISDGNRERLFDAFFTTRREAGGTGMGLGIVRALLTAHGGHISLTQATPPTFRMTLPREVSPS